MSDVRPDRWLSAIALVALGGLLVAGTPVATDPPPVVDRLNVAAQPAAAAAWPVSGGLLVSEVITGAGSASDEFVEIYNAAATSHDLGGLELVYVTASGSTVTRKQAWTELVVGPGRHVLIANSAGKWASAADGLYSGGFAATGGSLVLRTLDGTVVDSLSWGEAVSAFVEGAPGPAPAAGTSLERKPGGAAGNAADTNDNLADTRLEPDPLPQALSAPAVPAPGPSASPTLPAATPTAAPTAGPTPDATLEPTVEPTPEPSIDPTFEPTAAPTVDPTFEPTTAPTATPTLIPTPEPTPEPTPDPTPEPTPEPTAGPTTGPTALPSLMPTAMPTVEPTPEPSAAWPSVADVRALPLGTTVTARGRLTTPTGLTETGKGAFMEDLTAGIALYLSSADWPPLPVGTDVVVRGVLETRFSLLTLRLAVAADLVVEGSGPLPEPLAVVAGAVSEDVEGRLVSLQGVISEGISTLTDGFSTQIDDGTGQLRVVVAAATGIAPEELARGRELMLSGVIGQRDTSGTGVAGYRLHLRSLDDVVPLQPSGTPTPAPSQTLTPAPTAPTPLPTHTAAPTASPSPSADPAVAIAVARQRSVGHVVSVRGVVTVAPGRILGDLTFALQDSTAGICVRLAEADPQVIAGSLVEVQGAIASPYGNLELRPSATGVRIMGSGSQPPPRSLVTSQLAEDTEGLLGRMSGTIRRIEGGSSGSLTLMLEDSAGQARVFSHSPLGLVRTDFAVGQQLNVTGIVGDRLGLYRLWPRDRSDITITSSPPPPGGGPPTGSPRPTGTGSPSSPVITVADALRRAGQKVTVQATVTVRAGLLDADRRRVTVQDSTAAILVRLPAGASASVGQRLRITGEVGTYYGAPQLTASDDPVAVDRATVTPLAVRTAPLAAGLEWRLVTVAGRVESVHRDGDAWRAELSVSGGSVPISGLARSGIPSTALVAGRMATVTGLVKRAYPTATDQRLAIVPRSGGDIALGAAVGAGSSPPAAGRPGESPDVGAGPEAVGTGPAGSLPGQPVSVDVALSDLASYVGRHVRVGGRVERRDGARLVIADEAATAVIRLSGRAASLAPLFAGGELINAQGEVERNASGGLEVRVDEPGYLERVPIGRTVTASLGAAGQPAGLPATVDEAGGARTAGTSVVAAWLLLLAALIALAGMAVARRKTLTEHVRGLARALSTRFGADGPI